MSFASPVPDRSPFWSDEAVYERLQAGRARVAAELGKVIVGQHEVVEQLLLALLSGGHCLLTGAPGLAKTLLVKSVAQVFQLQFQRIQFTPDLMPADITGTEILNETPEGRRLTFVRGPIFANIILADEINRTPPKTQSALLEAMQEHRVTVAGRFFQLPSPFFVLATQNPIEQEGTYSLPEAQLDRFMFFIHVDYPSQEEERRIAFETTGAPPPPLKHVITGDQILDYQNIVQQVPVPDHIYDTAVRIVRRSRPQAEDAPDWIKNWVGWGAGPRAVQYLIRGAKARAVLQGSYLVRMEDLEAVAHPVLTHRILTNFQAQAEGVTSKTVIDRLLEEVRGEERRG
jgi:MoxR-like ATPase